MGRLNCILRLKDAAKLLFTLSWMSCIIYTLLLKLADDDFLAETRHVHLAEEGGNLLLSELGFISQPKLYPQGYHHIDEKEWPVFALSLQSSEVDKLIGFLLSFRTYFLDHRLVIFGLDLSDKQKTFVRERCFCQVREVWWKRYPSHVHTLKLQAYLPLLMQETLQEFGNVFWCDVHMKFNTSILKPTLSTQALTHGFVAWTRDRYPTSTYTHHNLYKYFDANQSDYFFHPMVFPVPGLYYNTDTLHRMIMKPWIECVLSLDCISPPGAQGMGCNLNIKPKYKYSGCHRYSTSAFNVVLGKLNNYQAPYIGKPQVFSNNLARTVSVVEYITQWNVVH